MSRRLVPPVLSHTLARLPTRPESLCSNTQAWRSSADDTDVFPGELPTGNSKTPLQGWRKLDREVLSGAIVAVRLRLRF